MMEIAEVRISNITIISFIFIIFKKYDRTFIILNEKLR